jgi:hypothetical protein
MCKKFRTFAAEFQIVIHEREQNVPSFVYMALRTNQLQWN